MTRGTTPTITVNITDTVDLTLAHNVYATLDQRRVHVVKSGEDVTVAAHSVAFRLSQKETLRFAVDVPVELQLNWTYADGNRGCTNIVQLAVKDNVERRELE